jgi:hypothetical protein
LWGNGATFETEAIDALCEAVRDVVILDTPLRDSEITLRDRLEGAREQGVEEPRQKVRMDPKREPIEITLESGFPPKGADHMWRYFWELNESRRSNGFGLESLSIGEIEAWERREFMLDCMNARDRLAARLQPFEFRALKAMDGAFLKAQRFMNRSKKR